MKAFFKFIVVLAVIIAALVIARNAIVKFAVEKSVEKATGLSLKIAKVDLGLATTYVGINDLELLSPEGFNDEVMFYAPEIFVDYNLGAMMKGKIHLEDIRLDFDRFVIVTNSEGKLNVASLKPKSEKESEPVEAQKTEKTASKSSKSPKIQIDHVALRIGKIVYKDYSKGAEPEIEELNVNISKEFDNVTDPDSIRNYIVTKVIMSKALPSLEGDLNIDGLKGKAESFMGAIKFPSQ